MIFLRIIATWVMIAAVIALVVDGTKSLALNDIIMTSLKDQWTLLHPASIALVEEGISRHLHPFIWDPLLTALLLWPSWAILGLIGILLFWAGRKRDHARIYMNY